MEPNTQPNNPPNNQNNQPNTQPNNQNNQNNQPNREPIKVLCIGDPHFKVNNIPESDDMVSKLIKITQHIKPKFIVVLGDILHRHEKIHVSPLMRAEKLIRLLAEISPTFVLIGNHDRPNNSTYMTNEHPFNAMKLWPNTYIVDEKVVDATIGGFRFLFVPYVFPGLFVSTLEDEKTGVKEPLKDTCAIFCHQEFRGAKMGMIKSQVGDVWVESDPLVISGHIHDYDLLQPNLIYVGTPMQHAFGDKEDKTISLYTFSDKPPTPTPNQKPPTPNQNIWIEERIDLELTKKIIVYLSPEKFHTYEPPSDKLVKIVVKGDDASIKAASKLEKVKELRKRGINVVFKANKILEVLDRKGPVLRMRYRDRLYTEICKDPKQLEWFNKFFK